MSCNILDRTTKEVHLRNLHNGRIITAERTSAREWYNETLGFGGTLGQWRVRGYELVDGSDATTNPR